MRSFITNALSTSLATRPRLARVALLIALPVAVLIALLVAVRGAAPAAGVTTPATGAAPPAGCDARPTVVLVHGAFADSSGWSGEIQRLQRQGYAVRAFANPLRSLTGDAADLADFLRTIPGPLVLVGHSYGGSVITNAAAGNPDVKALVYVDAAAPAVGETTAQLSGATSVLKASPATLYDRVPYRGAPPGGADLVLKEQVFLSSFAQDLPAPTARVLWASQRPAATLALSTPSAAAAWRTIPSWDVTGTADKIITPASQAFMAARAHAKVLLVPGGSHVTLISHPQAVTDQILAAARAVCPAR